MTTPITKKQNDDLLKEVQNQVILKQHTPENLLDLLLLCNPGMTLEQVLDDNQRVNAIKKLMVAIHPSNYPYNVDAQCIFEDIQRFYDLCCQNIAETKKNDEKGSQRGLIRSVRKRRRQRIVSPTSVVELVVQCK
jgi:hypothetical protein